MASNASTSFGYMAAGAGWDKSMMIKSGTASTIACIALCEGTHHLPPLALLRLSQHLSLKESKTHPLPGSDRLP